MILLNDFKRQWAECGPVVKSAVERVGTSGWYILGQEVDHFEKALAKWWGLPHAAGVANGMDAIEIALRALGLKPGDKVLTTPLSAFATTLAILRLGGEPVFVDTDESGLINLDQCEEYFRKNPSVKYFVPVHLYGHCLNLDRLEKLRIEFGLKIVEDCAQAHGARWKGKVCGSVGQFAATSFYPTKNLGALGDGGALLTRDRQLDIRTRELRDYGQSKKYIHDVIGLNSRLDELQAAILLDSFLPKLSGWTEARRKVATRYISEIKSPDIRFMRGETGSESVWHLFPVRVKAGSREAIRTKLQANGISSGVHYPMLITEQKALKDFGRFTIAREPKIAQAIADEELSLPIHPYLTEAEVTKVVGAC